MNVVSQDITHFAQVFSQWGDAYGRQLVRALALLVVVLLLTKLVGRLLRVILLKLGLPQAKATIAVTMLHILVIIFLTLFTLAELGFPTLSLFRVAVAVLLAGTAAFIIVKPYIPQLPFKIGHTIQMGDLLGKVEAITLINTQLKTFDGKTVFIPNQKILGNELVNFSFTPTRRVDLHFYIGYQEDLARVREIVKGVLEEDERVREKPVPRVVLSKLTPDHMEVTARFWVLNKHFLLSRWELTERAMLKLKEAGIEMAPRRMEIRGENRPGAEQATSAGEVA